MVRSMVLGILMSVVAASSLYAQEPAAPAEPAAEAQATPPNARLFSHDAGLFLVFIKPDKTADYEAVMGRLKEALAASENPVRKQQAASWKIFKSADPAGAGNVLYVITVDPAVKGADYDVVNILSEAFPAEAQALYNQYVGALAQGMNIVNLQLVNHLGQ
jgi:hypothetical protein